MTEQNIIDALKLLKVHYGSHTGVVSLKYNCLLANTEEEEELKTLPMAAVNLPDYWVEKYAGGSHNWEDVIELLKTHFDWETKSLPDTIRPKYGQK